MELFCTSTRQTRMQRIISDRIQALFVILFQRVQCPEKGCSFRSPVKIFLMHSHGKANFSNEGIDLESLRPSRPPGSRLLVLSSGLQESPVERIRGLRDQLHQVYRCAKRGKVLSKRCFFFYFPLKNFTGRKASST